jgi:alpha-tubulin suppressor-like RCC1 family protein
VTVAGLTGVASLAAVGQHACAVLASGAVRCWGTGMWGELGVGTTASSTPVSVIGITTATQVAGGADHSCAVLASGSTMCWGGNWEMALGRPTTSTYPNSSGPVVGNFTGGVVEAGGSHTCALLANRSVQCWGADNQGQLGNGSASSAASATPVAVTGLANVFALSAGTNHNCAIVVGGQAYCWGQNDHGQVGNGDSGAGKHVDAPVAITGLTDAIAISAGGNHSCAVKANRTAVCWGGNDALQVGGGASDPQPTPNQIIRSTGTLTGLVAISAGSGHTCATDQNGGGWCWGANGNGQLGFGLTSNPSLYPLQVSSLTPTSYRTPSTSLPGTRAAA